MIVFFGGCYEEIQETTKLTIYNNSGSNLYYVSWNDIYFGDDKIWNEYLGRFVYGIKINNFSSREILSGNDNIHFWPESYKTEEIIIINKDENSIFIYTDLTTLIDE